MSVKRVYILSLICIVLIMKSAAGQIEHKKIDRDYWQETKKGVRSDQGDGNEGYNDTWSETKDPDTGKRDGAGGLGKYKKELEKKSRSGNEQRSNREIISYEKDRAKEKSQSYNRSSSGNVSVPSWVGYLLLGVIAVALLFLLFKYFTGIKWGGNKEIPRITAEMNTEAIDLPESELQRLLRESLGEFQYREAVRIWFIFIIKRLRELEYIRWEKKKTNAQYLKEMSGRNESEKFSRAVLLFERIWYGKRELTKEQYNEIEPLFKELMSGLDKKMLIPEKVK